MLLFKVILAAAWARLVPRANDVVASEVSWLALPHTLNAQLQVLQEELIRQFWEGNGAVWSALPASAVRVLSRDANDGCPIIL